jgi:uncharacterized membrane protein YhaH (DUF805 family)
MNRTTALLLAMAALLAHALAVHMQPGGLLGQPLEESHAAFRLARNFVREGAAVWNPAESVESGGRGGLGAHASPLLVAVSAVAERLYLPVNRFVQLAGVLAALLTVAASARFATDRSVGVIPALLLVTSSAFAASATSGTEFPLIAFAVTLAFVGRERGRPLAFALGLTLLVAARAEGLVLGAVLALLALFERRGPARARAPIPWWSLVPATVTGVALLLTSDGQGGALYLTRLRELLTTAHLDEGGRYLVDFLVTSITPLLLVFPLIALARKRLSGEATRALLLVLVWCALITLGGGGPRPFTLALAPALPLIAIAVQFGIIAALDSRRPALEPLSWAALLLVAVASGLPSKAPSNSTWHKAWIEDALADPGLARDRLRGRASLQQELVATTELRDLGRFLREQVDPELSLLAPWSGVLGYLAGRSTFDLKGRRTGADPDLLATLQRGPDLILPRRQGDRSLSMPPTGSLPIDLDWIDHEGATPDPALTRKLLEALSDYELVTVPVFGERDPRTIGGRPLRLLRRGSLGLTPRLELHRDGAKVAVRTLLPSGGAGHPQLVHLEVVARDAEGSAWSLDPRGNLRADSDFLARSWLMVGIGEQRPIELYVLEATTSPSGAPLVEVEATLLNPRMRRDHLLAPASETTTLVLD